MWLEHLDILVNDSCVFCQFWVFITCVNNFSSPSTPLSQVPVYLSAPPFSPVTGFYQVISQATDMRHMRHMHSHHGHRQSLRSIWKRIIRLSHDGQCECYRGHGVSRLGLLQPPELWEWPQLRPERDQHWEARGSSGGTRWGVHIDLITLTHDLSL